MTTQVQLIERDGKPEYAVIPYADFAELTRLAEAMRDIESYDAALADAGETVPHDIMRRLVAGEHPLKVWREYRGLSQAALADQAGVDKTQLSQMEAGRKGGSVQVYRRLADVLGVEIDDLVVAAD
jgi:DNA-binding XRE family transcriptional regulator